MDKEFVDLINSHRALIFKVCRVYGYEKEYTEDLFQEIVLQLWKSYPTFRKESKVSTWMYRVALNTAISHFRKEVRKPKITALDSERIDIPELDPNHHLQLDLLSEAIQQLNKVEKAIVILYLEEKSYDEISEVMGISKSNVGVRINRIKTKLEKIIQQRSYELR